MRTASQITKSNLLEIDVGWLCHFRSLKITNTSSMYTWTQQWKNPLHTTLLYINPLSRPIKTFNEFLFHILCLGIQTLCIWILSHRSSPILSTTTSSMSLTSVDLFCSFFSENRIFILGYGHISCCFSYLEVFPILIC